MKAKNHNIIKKPGSEKNLAGIQNRHVDMTNGNQKLHSTSSIQSYTKLIPQLCII